VPREPALRMSVPFSLKLTLLAVVRVDRVRALALDGDPALAVVRDGVCRRPRDRPAVVELRHAAVCGHVPARIPRWNGHAAAVEQEGHVRDVVGHARDAGMEPVA